MYIYIPKLTLGDYFLEISMFEMGAIAGLEDADLKKVVSEGQLGYVYIHIYSKQRVDTPKVGSARLASKGSTLPRWEVPD
jgi:hypothetical protein